MPISDQPFDTESELQTWSFANIGLFFGSSILLPGFRITTASGKHSVPDGFVFNFERRQWWIVECELLKHGVWPHIAEQVSRFVVAARNPSTLRQLRDKVFEKILVDARQGEVAEVLSTDLPRLLQQLELFIEGVAPSLVILIDDTNQDLLDFCDSLDIPTEIYRIKKFVVNGQLEYYSPDRNQPIVVSTPESGDHEGSSAYDVIEQLGGGEVVSGKNRCYRLHDGRIVKVQYSKFHERQQAFWYGINPASYSRAKELGCSDFVFVMGTEGFVVVPLDIVDRYLSTAYATNNSDGKTRHYHAHITMPPDVHMTSYGNAPDIDVSQYFQPLG